MNGSITRVGVVGGGQMGAGIAEVCARAGLDTVICEADATAARGARERVTTSLERAVQRGKLDRISAADHPSPRARRHEPPLRSRAAPPSWSCAPPCVPSEGS